MLTGICLHLTLPIPHHYVKTVFKLLASKAVSPIPQPLDFEPKKTHFITCQHEFTFEQRRASGLSITPTKWCGPRRKKKHKFRHPHTNSSQRAQRRRVATKEQHRRKTQNHEQKRKTRETYLGHLRTPSSVSLGSGGFLSTLMPSFSTTLLLMLSVDALIDVNAKVLRFERWWLGDFSRDRFVNKPLPVAQELAISTYLFFLFFPLINLLLLSSDALYVWTKLCL